MPKFHKLFNGQWCRLTEAASKDHSSKKVFEYPDKAMRDGYKAEGVIPYITGFENNNSDGTGIRFNIIMSNGDRSI